VERIRSIDSLQLAGSYFRLSNTDQCKIIIWPFKRHQGIEIDRAEYEFRT
jgi:hypothetical protein